MVSRPMTVDAGEAVEPPQRRCVRVLVPIGLHRLEDSPVVRCQRLQAVQIPPDRGFGLVDRKLKLARSRGRILSADADGSGVDAVVQRRPEVVEPLANEHRHLRGRRDLLVNTHDKAPATLMHDGELVRVLLEEPVPHRSRSRSVRRCAIDASPTRVKQNEKRVGHESSRRTAPSQDAGGRSTAWRAKSLAVNDRPRVCELEGGSDHTATLALPPQADLVPVTPPLCAGTRSPIAGHARLEGRVSLRVPSPTRRRYRWRAPGCWAEHALDHPGQPGRSLGEWWM
jgi:hypothetical protein